MRTLAYLLFFFLVCSVTQAQNYYVASLQGEVFYNDVLLQKRDRIQVSGTLRFGSQDDWVKLSGPGGMYTLSADMGDEGSSEFLLTVRQELFPPVRVIGTLAMSNDILPYIEGGEEHLFEGKDAFMAEVKEHIRRCQSIDGSEFLFTFRFGDYLSEKYDIPFDVVSDLVMSKFGLIVSYNIPEEKYLWKSARSFYKLSDRGEVSETGEMVIYAVLYLNNESKLLFLPGTILPLPSSLIETSEKSQIFWLHEQEEGLSYRAAAVQENWQILIRENEFPDDVLSSAVIMTSHVAPLDSLVEYGSTMDDAFRYLCSCYGVGNYQTNNRIILREFIKPGILPREAFEEDMRFHIEVSQSSNLNTFMIDLRYGSYIYETYGNVYNISQILESLGLRDEKVE